MFAYLNDLHFAVFSSCFKTSQAVSLYIVTLEKTYFNSTGFQPNFEGHLEWFSFMSHIAEDVINKTPGATTVFTFIQDVFIFALMLLVPAYLFIVLLIGVFMGAKFLASSRLFSLLLTSAEQEFATPRALTLLLSLSLCLILASAGSLFFGPTLTVMRALYLTSIGAILYLVALLPVNLIYNWGAYFPIYVKGQSIKKSIAFELLTDYIHMLSFFLRINIQLIRLVIISCVFYMYNEMYVEFIYPTLTSDSRGQGAIEYVYAGAAFALKLAANLIYEVGHLWIMVGMQSGAFVMIIFVITQFLYSVYLIHRLQPFFVALRKKKNNTRL